MLKLLALAPEDGWAFVQRDAEILLVRPPYRRSSMPVVSEATVEKAIHAHGFTAAQEEFDDWEKLITALQQRFVETRKALGQAVSDNPGLALLPYAPRRILEGYLTRIETELLPQREWRAAQDLLITLLGLEAVKSNGDLLERVSRLLQQCHQATTSAPAEARLQVDAVEDLTKRFPYATQRYPVSDIRQYTDRIRSRHQVLWVAA